jgi:hypothetical protein
VGIHPGGCRQCSWPGQSVALPHPCCEVWRRHVHPHLLHPGVHVRHLAAVA